jgi:hypothetical protein
MSPVHPDSGALSPMILWSIGTAVLAIWFVFGDPRFDYRTLVIGALAPLLIDSLTGGSWVMHSVTMSVLLMAAVMLATIGQRPLRRSLLGLPLGSFLYLVFSGAWANQTVFWWPFTGWSPQWGPLPLMSRGWWNLPMEVAGAVILLWIYRTTGLHDRTRRQNFLRTGQLHLPSSAAERSTC